MTLTIDRTELDRFVVCFRHADLGTFASMRAFFDRKDGSALFDDWRTVRINGNPEDLVDAAEDLAKLAALDDEAICFAPPIATFSDRFKADVEHLANGLVITAELDASPATSRVAIEAILGPATIVMESGGLWLDPATGESSQKLHLHWLLSGPTRTRIEHDFLREANRLVATLADGDPSAISSVHPLRWAGSWHRKAEPRLARIIAYNPEIEISLAEALNKLRDAASSKGNGRDRAAGGASVASQGSYSSKTGHRPSSFGAEADAIDVASALFAIPNNERNWKKWSDIGMAVWHASGGSSAGYAAYLAWSSKFEGFDPDTAEERWEHFGRHPPGAIGAGSLFHMARQASPRWERPSDAQRRRDNDPGDPPPHQVDPAIPVDDVVTRKPNGHDPAAGNGHDTETAAWGEPPQAEPWPEIDAEAFHGLAGEIVHAIENETEADPVALLISLLVMAGNMFGRGPHAIVGRVIHYLNLFAVFVGATARGRKGTSEADVTSILSAADSDWALKQIESGLSSGEGVIWRVHDEVRTREKIAVKGQKPQYVDVIKEENVSDKRLMVIEPEFAGTLAVMKRDGSILSRVLRDAWDGRRLASLTKNNNTHATGAHVSMIAHITADDLRASLDRVSFFNGYANRYLFVCVKRSKLLPFGGVVAEGVIAHLADRLRETCEVATVTLARRPISFDKEAAAMWDAEYRTSLSIDRPGLLGAVTARAEAHTLRLAALYAVLDHSRYISCRHLLAALAVWRYCEASARFIFGDAIGDPVADEILDVLRKGGASGGMTRTELYNFFGRNRSSDDIGKALRLLLKHNKVQRHERPNAAGRGKPAETWAAL